MKNKLVESIRKIRKRKGISQQSLAFDLGIDYSTYGKIERGKIGLTTDRFERIAEILGFTPSQLYELSEELLRDSSVLDRILTELELAKNEVKNFSKKLTGSEV